MEKKNNLNTKQDDEKIHQQIKEWEAIYENTISHIEDDPQLMQQAREFFGVTKGIEDEIP